MGSHLYTLNWGENILKLFPAKSIKGASHFRSPKLRNHGEAAGTHESADAQQKMSASGSAAPAH